MKAPKAIEILEEDLNLQDTGEPSKYQDAIKLSIEALKHICQRRKESNGRLGPLLPGETPEDE